MKNPNKINISITPESSGDSTDFEDLMNKKIQDKLQQQAEDFVGDDLESMRDMQNYLKGRPTEGSYIENRTIDKSDEEIEAEKIKAEEEKDPLKKGIFEGDVFYSKSDDGSEIVYAVESAGDVNGTQVYTISETYNNGSEKKQVVTLEEASALLAGKDLVDGGYDRPNAVANDYESTYNKSADSSISTTEPAATPGATPGVSRAVSLEDITKLRNTANENWAKTPDTSVASTPESSARNAYPSSDEIEAARKASGEISTPETPAAPASTGETEPSTDEKEKAKNERRISKMRRGFNRALGWLLAERNDGDDEESMSSSKTKTIGLFGGLQDSYVEEKSKWQSRRAAKVDNVTVVNREAETTVLPEPTEADRAAAAAAVKADAKPTTGGKLRDKAKQWREKGYTSR